jgi:hypothetical protein
VFDAATGRGGAVSHLATVPVADLLRWAAQIDDEIGLDDVAGSLRAAANDPDADLLEALRHVRGAGEGCTHCHNRHKCTYHEGWHDALDLLEDELP